MQIPTLIFILLLLSCFASTQDYEECFFSYFNVENFRSGFDGRYFAKAELFKRVYQMEDKCIWCLDY